MESQYTSSFDTWLFWPCILEQPRVEFDTALFHITGPEQHRVKYCLIVWRYISPIDIQWNAN